LDKLKYKNQISNKNYLNKLITRYFIKPTHPYASPIIQDLKWLGSPTAPRSRKTSWATCLDRKKNHGLLLHPV
jgi:hypothetical protein